MTSINFKKTHTESLLEGGSSEEKEIITTGQGLKMIFGQSVSPIIGNILHPMYMMVNTVILGRMVVDDRCSQAGWKAEHPDSCISPSVYQSGFGIGSSTMSILMMAPTVTFTLAMTNLIPQAYGAKNYKLCGVYLNRVLITLTLIFLPLLFLLQIFCKKILLLLGIDEFIAEQAALYVKIVSPGVIVFGWSNTVTLFGSLQGKPFANIWNKFIPSILHIFLTHYLAITLDWKMTGVAIATLIHMILRFVFALSYVLYKTELRERLQPFFHEDSFKDLGNIAHIGKNNVMLKVMGWWAFDVFTQLAAQLPNTDNVLAAQTNLRNIGLYTYMIPVGLSSSANFFTGKYIGKQRVDLAAQFAKLCMVSAFIWAVGTIVTIVTFKSEIHHFYSRDEGVQKAMASAWNVILVFVLFDCLQGVSNGLIQGLKLTGQVKWITMLGYWIIGIPISLLFMFKYEMGLTGLWLGPTVACMVNYAYYQFKVNTTDWEQVSESIQADMKAAQAKLKSD